MNEEPFEPRNDLERQLMDAQEGKISGDIFMSQLLVSQVFMPVNDKVQIQGFQSNRTRPLTLQSEDGTDVLVLFTSPERAKPFLTQFPDYAGGLLMEFKEVIEKLGRQGAEAACRSNGWDGVLQELKQLSH